MIRVKLVLKVVLSVILLLAACFPLVGDVAESEAAVTGRVVFIPFMGEKRYWKGEWSDQSVYKKSDLVHCDGNAYISLRGHVADHLNSPPDPSSWDLVASGGIGSTGTTGTTGPAGPQGLDGPQGDQGPQGDIGAPGAPGLQGNQGPAGSQGSQGDQGPQGDAGAPGAAGLQGSQGPAGSQGSQGDQGPQGDAGTPGAAGLQGSQGPAGSQGSQGDQGPQGDAGTPGAAGLQGSQGPAGSQGSQGDQGPQGDAGAQGPQGEPGPAGGTSTTAVITGTAYSLLATDGVFVANNSTPTETCVVTLALAASAGGGKIVFFYSKSNPINITISGTDRIWDGAGVANETVEGRYRFTVVSDGIDSWLVMD